MSNKYGRMICESCGEYVGMNIGEECSNCGNNTFTLEVIPDIKKENE